MLLFAATLTVAQCSDGLMLLQARAEYEHDTETLDEAEARAEYEHDTEALDEAVCKPWWSKSTYPWYGSDGKCNWKHTAGCGCTKLYAMYNTGGCPGQNELGTYTGTNIKTCQEKCDKNDACVSMEYRLEDKKCQLSTSCFADTRGSTDRSKTWTFYAKEQQGASYRNPYLMSTGGCPGMNLDTATKTLAACQEWCDETNDCVSFEFDSSNDKCQISADCTYEQPEFSSDSDEWLFFEKQK